MRKKKWQPLYVTLRGGNSKDFHVRVISEERLVSTVQSRDSEFDEDMYNYGDSEDLPDSDRLMVCQHKGVKQQDCQLD